MLSFTFFDVCAVSMHLFYLSFLGLDFVLKIVCSLLSFGLSLRKMHFVGSLFGIRFSCKVCVQSVLIAYLIQTNSQMSPHFYSISQRSNLKFSVVFHDMMEFVIMCT